MLKEQWNADPDRDPRDRDRDRRRGRGPNQNRGRGRYRDRGRHSRGNDRRYDYPRRSPPPRASRFEPDSSHDSGGFASQRSPPRGSPGASPGFHVSRHSNNTRPPSSSDWDAHPSGSLERDNQGPRRAESPFGPPSKRQRTRSPSPRGPRTSFSNRRSSYSKHSDRRDRSPPFRGRGRGRGAPRGRSPRRGRDRRGRDRRRSDIPAHGYPKSPVRERGPHPSPGRRSPSLSIDYSERDSRYRSRSRSRDSARSSRSRGSASPFNIRPEEAMNANRSNKLGFDSSGRSPSPQGPAIGGSGNGRSHIQDALPPHGIRGSDMRKQHQQLSKQHLASRQYSRSPHFTTPTSSHRGSPPPRSPYRSGRGGWGDQPEYSSYK